MIIDAFSVHDGLLGATRLPAPTRADTRISSLEMLLLIAAGGAAAIASAYMRLGLRVPGSAILWAVIPMALGLALVPRRFSGLTMSASALVTASALSVGGMAVFGVGALTSLCLTGPMLDVALLGARPGWRLYARLIAAGIGANVGAFVQRGASKLMHADLPGTRMFGEWLGQALITYTLAGAVAGLIAALCWFELCAGRRSRGGNEQLCVWK